MAGTEIGTYFVVPTILSFEGVDKQVNSKLGKMFGDVGKKGGKDLSKGIGEGLRSTEADLKKAGDAYNKLRDKAADALGKVRREESALQDLRDKGITSGPRFVAVEERLATARRNSVRAVRDANDSYSSFLNTQKKLGAGTDELGGKLSRLGSFAGSAGKQLASAGAIAGGAALAGIALLGAGIAAAGRELYDLGAQFDELSDTLQVKTGLTGTALDALKGSVEKLGTTNVPSTFAEIGDVAAEVTRNLHLTGKPLEEITSRLANLDRMGQSVDVRSLGKAFRGFGVDVKGQVPALNSLYEASTKSGLSIDDMLASVVKGGPALRALGLTFGESAALIATFEDAGLDADKSVAGLTKGLANFSKNGKTGSAALRDAVTQIQNLTQAGNEAGAIDLANKLFGAKGGVAFFDAIKSGALDLQSLSDSLQSTGIDINDVSADTADWAEKWQTLKNEVAVALEPLAGTVFDQVNGELDNLSVWVKGHKGEIIDFFVSLGEGAISAAEVTTSALAGVVDFLHLFDTIVMKSLSWLPGYDDEAAKAFNDSLGDLSDKLNAASDSGMWQNLRNQLHGFGEDAKNSGADVDALSGAIGQLAGQNINVPINVDTDPANVKMKSFFDTWNNAVIDPKVLPPGGGPIPPSGPQNPLLVPYPRAAGGIFDVWDSVASFANGKLPNQAMIQPPVPGAGLVQWAEPATAGEAFIPLASSKRNRSLAIWHETGRRLNAFDDGGIRDGIDAPPPGPPGESGPARNIREQQWWKDHPEAAARERQRLTHQDDGLSGWQRFWKSIGFESGGIRGIDALYAEAQALTGTKYSMGAGDDCSGTMSQLVNATLGLPPKIDRMSTMTAAQWLAKKGAYPGLGPPGTFSLGWKNGGPGGGHMAGTLPDGTHVEMGGANGGYTLGGNAKGADDPTFTDHAYLPIEALYPDGYASGSGVSPYGSSGGSSGGMAGVGPNGESGTYSAPDQATVAEKTGQVREADAKVAEAEAKLRELKSDAKDSEKIRAQNDVESAKNDAAKARADLAEAKKGKFTPNKAGGKGSGDLSEIGSIFGSFLKETTGFDGSIFPDISNLMPVQMANTLLGALIPQQGSEGTFGATSSSPFGIPDIAVPAPPPGSPASGFGAGPLPGPAGPNVTIDQSIHGGVNGSIDQVMKQRDEGLKRAIPRIPVGS